jgi:hypothetical protein
MRNRRESAYALAIWGLVGVWGLVGSTAAAATTSPRPPSAVLEDDNGPDPEGPSLVGEVTEINHESGEFVLNTAAGPLRLVAPPADLKGIKIGDVLKLALVDDETH